jgi:hypothetical protein
MVAATIHYVSYLLAPDERGAAVTLISLLLPACGQVDLEQAADHLYELWRRLTWGV